MLMLKVVLAPALIALASGVERRWGPAVGGWFVALPLTTGPVLFILSIERGQRFAATAAAGALLAVVSLAAFVLAYTWSASRASWPVSGLAGGTAYLGATWLLQSLVLPVAPSMFIACAALLGALRALPNTTGNIRPTRPPAWDIPVRMALAMTFVVTIAWAAPRLGPRLSGLLTPFPIAATILAAFTHALHGSNAVSRLSRGLLLGLFSFSVFLLVVAIAIERLGVAGAFAAATVSTLAFHAVTHRWTADRTRIRRVGERIG